MSKEITVREPETVVANTTSELPALQAPLLGWARKKLEEAREEHAELLEAIDEARKANWKLAALQGAARKAAARYSFYDKVVAALDAGYMLFPPVPNADIIAFRAVGRNPGVDPWLDQEGWRGSPNTEVQMSTPLPKGEGEYLDPVAHYALVRTYKDDKNNERKEWKALDLEDPTFPLLMGKPQIIRATNAAMEQKIFDEIRMFPFERRPTGDPCILGSIVDRRNGKSLYFLISWRINASDL
jgi:hypothetical protein